MADKISKEERSRNMAAIRSKDTKPEVYLRKRLFASGLRYRKNCPAVVGHPDIYITKYKAAIFVNGCYWHRHSGCKYAYTPKTRIDFWNTKFDSNIKRDQIVKDALLSQHIKCLVVWECTINRMMKDTTCEEDVMNQIICFLENDRMYIEL